MKSVFNFGRGFAHCVAANAIALVCLAGSVHAEFLFNTGVNKLKQSNPIPSGTVDLHYQVGVDLDMMTSINESRSSGEKAYVWKKSSGFPIPQFYLDDTNDSGWIAPTSPVNDPVMDDFTDSVFVSYTTSFKLSSVGDIAGIWSVDDFGVGIFVNGVSAATSSLSTGFVNNNGPKKWSEFFLDASLFNVGVNDITFVTQNRDQERPNPTALRVEFTEAPEGAIVPEPATLALLGLGTVGFIGLRRRMNRV